jgi:ABC-type Fe3+ transport system substrate-binding protein
MTHIVVYATAARTSVYRDRLSNACRATGISVQLELFGSGSLFQRLRGRGGPPRADLVLGFGPYMAQAAAQDGLLQPYQPKQVADLVVHEREWRWVSVDLLPFVVSPAVGFDALPSVPRLALADPERSEIGIMAVLATLDRARQTDGDPERAWDWWRQRAAAGLSLAEDDRGVQARVAEGRASHALGLLLDGTPVAGLAPVPNAIGIAAGARNLDGAYQLVDWLVGSAPLSGLRQLVEAAPPLDVEWCTSQYRAVRERWRSNGWSPS